MDIEKAPAISQVSRIGAFGSLGIFVVVFAWMDVSFLLTWIRTSAPPPTFTGTTVWVIVLGTSAILWWFGTHIFRIFSTHLSVQGISIPTIRGRVLVPWSDIERVQVKGHELRLWNSKSSILLNVFCFTKPERVSPFVRSHLPAHIVSQLGS
jgi:hypothetical protein